jgi:predicted Zn-dependent protease
MSKKHHKHSTTGHRSARARQGLHTQLARAEQLRQDGRLDEAIDLLQKLERHFPNDAGVLALLAATFYDSGDFVGFQFYTERLVPLRPDDPYLLLSLAIAYMENQHPALAARTFRQFLERYPDHPERADARTHLEKAESALDPDLLTPPSPTDDGLDLAVLYDRMIIGIDTDDYPTARQAAQALLSQWPDYIPALTVVSIADFTDGDVQQAIARSRHVLDLEPTNHNALANLIHFLVVGGQEAEARQILPTLLALEDVTIGLLSRQAEALTSLGEDEGVLAVYRKAEAHGFDKPPDARPELHHLAAVAALRLGDEKRARQLWQQALAINPVFGAAHDNLADMELPIDERHAPWPFPLSRWFPPGLVTNLPDLGRTKGQGRSTSVDMGEVLNRWATQVDLVSLTSNLLDRGDPQGREFAMSIALEVDSPAMHRVLHDFALSRRGPDEIRLIAAQAAARTGLLPDGPVRLWIEGKWHRFIPLPFDITWEPLAGVPRRAMDLYARAVAALQAGKSDEAERLTHLAVARAPNSPVLLNNLAFAYKAQGREDEARALLQQIYEQFPDYFLTITATANAATENSDFDQAESLLKPLMQRDTLHFTEFENLCIAYIKLGLANKDRARVTAWLHTWEMVDPESPQYEEWRRIAARTLQAQKY